MSWDEARRGLAATATAAALATGVAACGSSDDSDGSSARANQGKASAESSNGGTSQADRQAVVALMSALQKRYNARNGAGFCELLTPAGVNEVHDFARTHADLPHTCAPFIKRFSGAFEQTPVQARSVTVNGDRGAITMRGGLAGIRSIATYKVSRASGEWRLVNPISGAETRRLGE